ncbi:MAG: peptidoglycan D,D-transpeptidase FtsI family protein [Rhodomicrobium sp.]
MRTLASAFQSLGGSPGQRGAAKNARRAQVLLSLCFVAGFCAVSGRAIYYAAVPGEMPMLASAGAPPALAKARPDIVDRNGRILATDIRAYWLAANPKEIPHADDAAEKLAALFPDLNQAALSHKFHDKASRFEWVKRGLVPGQATAAHALGIPGLSVLATVARVYPQGNDAAQILGLTNVDNEGMSGVEWYIDQKLAGQVAPASLAKRPIVKLSLDLGVQHVLAEELGQAMQRYRAAAALGLVLDVRNGEVLASVSLPDFDPNRREQAMDENRRNRIVTDVYELGSVFKTFTVAMALDAGVADRYSRFDTGPLMMGHFLLRDVHAAREPVSVEDIFVHSINTGAARIAREGGIERQQSFLRSLGLFDKFETEAGTAPKPRFPATWVPANAMTIAYGHGIAVPPITFASAMATIVNGGKRIKPTFLLSDSLGGETPERVVKPETSAVMRELMRLVVQRGTGHRAAVAGLDIGGKTGTALKAKDGHYTHDVVNSFVAVLPASDPEYLILVTLDEPKPETPGKLSEAAYNAAPTAGALIKRIAPMLNVLPAPRFDETAPTPYEQAGPHAQQRAVLRKNPYETSGFDPGYSAYREREPASGPGYFGPYGR